MTGLELVALVVAVFSWGFLLVDLNQRGVKVGSKVGSSCNALTSTYPAREWRCVRLLPAEQLYDWENEL